MSNILDRTSNTITIAEFWENEQLGKYNYEPPYQRKSVWSEEKQSYFIDSLLRNYPVPPIFLHKKIDDATGKQTFDVIDGKQRLMSIVKFLKNEIAATSDIENDILSGVYFEDLNIEDKINYKKLFWRYELQIQYIDTDTEKVIDDLFDRLNRNGEKLNGQELRQAKYHNSKLLQVVDDLSNKDFWKKITENYDLARMEDKEFISELLFVLIDNKPLDANQSKIDNYYIKYHNYINEDIISKFNKVSTFFESLRLDFQENSIAGVSHIYGLWCFCNYCVNEEKDNIEKIRNKLISFYNEQKKIKKEIINENVKIYKESMSSATKSYSQRNKRMNALIDYVFEI